MKTTKTCSIITLLMIFTLIALPNSSAQGTSPEYVVRSIYFHAKDVKPRLNVEAEMDKLLKDVQQFYADEMERHGLSRKTFRLETDRAGQVVVHPVKGRFVNSHYHQDPFRKILSEIRERFDDSDKDIEVPVFDEITHGYNDTDKNIEIVVADDIGRGGGIAAGQGIVIFSSKSYALINSVFTTTLHEIGHAFGLNHDWRTGVVMSYGDSAHLMPQLSKCTVEWLDVNRFFNRNPTDIDTPTTIEMLPPLAYPPNAIRLRFRITDADGLHQVQLSGPSNLNSRNGKRRAGVLLDCKLLNGKSNTVEFVNTELALDPDPYVILHVVDKHGNTAADGFYVRENDVRVDRQNRIDINGDGVTNADDRVPVSFRKVSGDNQLGIPNAWLPKPLAVEVLDASGDPAIGVGVEFRMITILEPGKTTVTDYGLLSDPNPRTDANGRAQSFLFLASTYDNPTVYVRVAGISKQLTFSINPEPQVLISQSQRPPMYWVDAGTLHRLTGAKVETLAPDVQNATSLAVDMMSKKLYWTEKSSNRTGKIRRANFDGTNVQLVKDLTSVPHSIAIDSANGKLYLTNSWGKVQRLNFDGSNFQPNLITGLEAPKPLTLDVADGQLYWTEQTSNTSGKIQRANLNGSNVQLVKSLTSAPRGLAFDAINRKLYLTNGWGKVQWLDVNGSNFKPNLITELDGPKGVSVDVAGRKIYWAEQSSIRRADLNGENIEDVVTDLGAPTGIVLGTLPAAAPAAPAIVERPPDATVLLANYPNPFNPETWLPYQLSEPAAVRVTIYDSQGNVVRALELGYQRAGIYQDKSRAAYWDGRNEQGEHVASGVYFYTLETGDFAATRKMLILK